MTQTTLNASEDQFVPRRRRRGRRRSPGGMSPRDLRQLARLPRAPGIRIRTRCDGFGAQYLAQISALAWALQEKRYFYYEPFSKLDHGEDAASMSEFTGLRSWGTPADFKKLSHVRFVPEVLKAPNPSLYFNAQLLRIIREMYYSAPKPSACKHAIAIHIRRGDINKGMKSRWLPEKVYIQLVRMLRQFFPGKSIGIYSQGAPSEFSALTTEGATLELSRDLRETFHELATAPVLIPAPSCLSYSAAILSEGTIIHLANDQNKPLDHWLHSRALSMKRSQLLKIMRDF
jgi:hypothetical protein